jgi:hypothetical protein
VLSLPHELTDAQRLDLVRDFVAAEFVAKGMIADVAIHAPDRRGDLRNHHDHVMLTMRSLTGEGFGKKVREWNDTEQLEEWRERWADAMNRHLERAGLETRVDHRSLADRGLDREPEPKQGALATKMEREGQQSHAGDDRRAAKARNAEREELAAELATITAQIVNLDDERAKRQTQTSDSQALDQPSIAEMSSREGDTSEEVGEASRATAASRGNSAAEAGTAPDAEAAAAGVVVDHLPDDHAKAQAFKHINAPIAGRCLSRSFTKVESAILIESRAAPTSGAFLAALYQQGITFARVDAQGIDGLTLDQQEAFRDDKDFYVPKFRDGELVAVNRFGGVHKLNPRVLDVDALEASLTVGHRDVAPLSQARELVKDELEIDRQAYLIKNAEFWESYAERREERDAANLERAGIVYGDRDEPAADVGDVADSLTSAVARGGKALIVALDFVGDQFAKVTDFVASMFDGGSGARESRAEISAPGSEAKPTMSAHDRHEARLRAFIEADQQQRQAEKQERAHLIGASEALPDLDLKREEEKHRQASTGRGYGV